MPDSRSVHHFGTRQAEHTFAIVTSQWSIASSVGHADELPGAAKLVLLMVSTRGYRKSLSNMMISSSGFFSLPNT